MQELVVDRRGATGAYRMALFRVCVPEQAHGSAQELTEHIGLRMSQELEVAECTFKLVP
jgi:hypothetical protein